ncbi:hypothetical protein TIFTF001_041846, partial [Ficus carica]
MNRRLNLDIPQNNTFLLPRDILAAADHLIGMKFGMGILDDMNHLKNKRIRSVADLLQDQFALALVRLENMVRGTICGAIRHKLIPTPQNLLTSTTLTTTYESFFGLHPLSQVLDRTNPLTQIVHGRKVSYLGPGGLTGRTASFRIRDIHPSHYGRICPIDTSEGINVGLIGSLSIHARVGRWGSLESPFYEISERSKKVRILYLSPSKDEYYMVAAGNSLALNLGSQEEQVVPARYRQEFLTIEWEQVHLRSIFPFQYFSIGASLIPFIEHNDANRALMSSNMQRQAVPLSRSEKCIVGTGLECQVALDSGAPTIAEHEGKIIYTDTEKIILSGNRDTLSIPLVIYQRSNKNTCMHQKPQVAQGKCIKKGQILADGAATVGGELALGKNVLVAYMPWEGYNFEDAVLINERLVYEDIYTSFHIRKYEIQTHVTSHGPERITNEIPHLEAHLLRNLDKKGIVMLGSWVETGDILVGKLTPQIAKESSYAPEDRLLRAILGIQISTSKETCLKLPIGGRGRVIDVRWIQKKEGSSYNPETIRVYISQKREIKVGDKVAGRHGNKGIVSKILPRQDMPYLQDGRPVDMVFNPLGVPSRMNVGQIFECSLGLAGGLLDRHYRIAPFDERYEQEASRKLVFSELYEASKQTANPWVFEPEYPGKSRIFDGRTGDPFEQPVIIGKPYILKLIHQVDDKIHGRCSGHYALVTQQPLRGRAKQGGQRVGEMEVWALEGFGVAHILQEMLTYKSDHIRARQEVLGTTMIGGPIPKPEGAPESFRLLVRELRSLALELNHFLNEKLLSHLLELGCPGFDMSLGRSAIREQLTDLDLRIIIDYSLVEWKELGEERPTGNEWEDRKVGRRKDFLVRRIELAKHFIRTNIEPEWMVLCLLPVLPPELRPIIQIDGGKLMSSDINELYRRVIYRNNTLIDLLTTSRSTPGELVMCQEKLVQEAVDTLFDNGIRGQPMKDGHNKVYKSFSDVIEGKEGRFRETLLGKRVDYSGRSVIVVGPSLSLHRCGLPREIAIELFQTFVIRSLIRQHFASNIGVAKSQIREKEPVVWEILQEVMQGHPVLLNRAPTLHRLGIQAFQPILVEGHAICLHPLVCKGFNADFDGDQMAVHVPLSLEAQAEARLLMFSHTNLLSPAIGDPISVPTQDMLIGLYVLTSGNRRGICANSVTSSPSSSTRTIIPGFIRESRSRKGSFPIIDSNPLSNPTHWNMEVLMAERADLVFRNKVIDGTAIKRLISRLIDHFGMAYTSHILDQVKTLGFRQATATSISLGIDDLLTIPSKGWLVQDAEQQRLILEKHHHYGNVHAVEKLRQSIEIWYATSEYLRQEMNPNFRMTDPFNPVHMMSFSGARGNASQVHQLVGMRGLMSDPQGQMIDLPIQSNLREGLSLTEYIISCYGARKGVVDTAVRTSDAGYLTRRLVEVVQHIVVRRTDCGTIQGIFVSSRNGMMSERIFIQTLIGRVLADDIYIGSRCIAVRNQDIGIGLVNRFITFQTQPISIRTPFTCKSTSWICRLCYGRSPTHGDLVELGEAVGIIAGQSIGEPGTQLTLRTFHTGGVFTGVIRSAKSYLATPGATVHGHYGEIRSEGDTLVTFIYEKSRSGDITQGLPKVEQVLEVRSIDSISMNLEKRVEGWNERITRILGIPWGFLIGAELTIVQGRISLVNKIQKVYRSQGVQIHNRHIEIIVRQITSKVLVSEDGMSNVFLPGELIGLFRAERTGRALKEAICYRAILLGITKASLNTQSFISEASFQETARVLAKAALRGRIDWLKGLKENVVLGGMIPVGVHFGHGTRKWNPRMAPYISAKRKASRGKQFLIVGTKNKAADSVAQAGIKARCHYVNKKWLGGMLTNWYTTETRLHKFRDLRTEQKTGRLKRLPKRDAAVLKRQLSHLQTYLGGIKYMTGLPDIVIIVDQQEEYTALRECITLGIPTICLIDTNCDPDLADISIPANDDAIASIRLILNKLVFAICSSIIAVRNPQTIPTDGQNFFEYVLEFIRDVSRTQIGEEYGPW